MSTYDRLHPSSGDLAVAVMQTAHRYASACVDATLAHGTPRYERAARSVDRRAEALRRLVSALNRQEATR
jgi:hypothetical protein